MKHKMLHETLKIGIWDWIPNKGELNWDAAMRSLYGVPLEEKITYQVWADLVHPDDLKILESHAEELLRNPNKKFDINFRILRRDGQERWVRTIAHVVLHDDGAMQVIGANFDVSDLVHDQMRMIKRDRESQQQIDRLQLALKVTGTGVWDWDIGRNEMIWNRQMYQIYGIEPNAYESADDAWHATLHPDDWDRVNDEIQASLRGQKSFNSEYRVKNSKGETRWIQSRGEVVRNAAGQAVRMLGSAMDITDKKLAEIEIDEQRVVNIHQSRLAAIGQLAAGVGHEINNPLTVVVGKLNRIQRLIQADHPDLSAIQSDLEKQRIALERVATIVQGLRNFSAFSPADFQMVNIVESTRQTLSLVQEIFRVDGIDLQLEAEHEEVWVYGDSNRIQQVVMNLLSNAKDAVSESALREIKVQIGARGSRCFISISDSGCGIPSEIQKRVFDNFFSTKAVGHGTGIGLALSSTIAQEHEGELSFQSDSSGTIFTLDLPLKRIDSSKPGPPPLDPQSLSGRLLVVEDQAEVREVLVDLFRDHGMEVDSAANGRDGLELAEKNHYDVILVDLKMPEVSGTEMIAQLVKNSRLPTPKVVVMTAATSERLESLNDKGLSDVIHQIVLKPFDDEAILSVIRQCLPKNPSVLSQERKNAA